MASEDRNCTQLYHLDMDDISDGICGLWKLCVSIYACFAL